jgi:hypothetical protein
MRYALNNSLSAIQRGWVWLWPNCPPSSALAKVTARDPFGNAVCSVTVRREVSELALILLNESIRRGYRIFAAQTGSFNCRKIAGTNSPSNHSGGLAIDMVGAGADTGTSQTRCTSSSWVGHRTQPR